VGHEEEKGEEKEKTGGRRNVITVFLLSSRHLISVLSTYLISREKVPCRKKT